MATQNGQPGTRTLLSELVDDIQRLAKLEADLARTEIKELVVNNGIAAGSLVGAGVLAGVALLVGVPVWAVMSRPNHSRAAGTWVGLYLGAAAGLAAFGRSRLQLRPPQKTITSLKENGEWIAQRIKSSTS